MNPPKDYDAWGRLIGALVQHWVDRYGLDTVKTWYFECWVSISFFLSFFLFLSCLHVQSFCTAGTSRTNPTCSRKSILGSRPPDFGLAPKRSILSFTTSPLGNCVTRTLQGKKKKKDDDDDDDDDDDEEEEEEEEDPLTFFSSPPSPPGPSKVWTLACAWAARPAPVAHG